MVLPREFLLFCVSFLFSRCLLHNPSPPFIMEFFWVSRVPLFCSSANRACSVPVALVSPFAVFSHSFLLLVLIPSKASSRPSSLGRAEVCPSRYPHFWRIPLFRFGWNLVLPFLKVLRCYSFFPVLVPRGPFAVYVMRGRFALLVFFFFSCLLFTDLSQSSFLFVLEGFWGSLLIYIFVVVSFGMLFSFSGLQDPLGLPPMGHPCLLFFGLSLDFSFGLDLLFHFFWA